MPFLDNCGYSEWAAKFQEKIKFEDKCDSYPQMSLFVRWNNNLKNTHFSITW